MSDRIRHDTSFAIASAMTVHMERRLQDGELRQFHKAAYQISKAAIERHDLVRERLRLRSAAGWPER